MQGKGIIKFFLVMMAVVCMFYYSLMIPTNQVESAAEDYANSIAQNYPTEKQSKVKAEYEAKYLDSINSESIWSLPLLKDFSYEDLKRHQLGLGLDLKGGMSVILQVDLREFIIAMANSSKDPTFIKALDKASQDLSRSQKDYVTLFAEAFNEIGGDQKLAPIFIRNEGLREDINFETPNSEVIQKVREKANETVKLTHRRLKERIDQLGVVQPNVSLDAGRDLILVELPGIQNPGRARKFLEATAKLEFWNVYRATDPGIIATFAEADRKVEALLKGDTTDIAPEPEVRKDTSYTIVRDSLGNAIDSQLNVVEVPVDPFSASKGRLLKDLELNFGAGGQLQFPRSVIGRAAKNKTRSISKYLAMPAVRSLFPNDVMFLWSQKPEKYTIGDDESAELYELYAIKKRRGSDKAPLEGDVVTTARTAQDMTSGQTTVSLKMNRKGTEVWGNMTTNAAKDGNREIAIVLDSLVVSAPSVQNAITGGDSQITGNFSVQEAQDLASILQIGKLPATPRIIQENVVGPSLGKDNINRSMKSLLVGFFLVLMFMVYYYGRGGIVSILALFLNLFFIFGVLNSSGAVMTLPGFAGILLTIGMAVDANVIIYERIREELREGKTMAMAVRDGFHHSYSAIIDANVTTILVAFVLFYFGLGPIKGFAAILIIGVICSLFTAVLVGRLMIEWWMNRGGEMSFWTNSSKNMFANLKIDWLSKRKIAYVFSGTIIALGIISMFAKGWDLGVDFKGGYSFNVQFEEAVDVDIDKLRSELTAAFDGTQPVVKEVSGANTFNIVSSYLIDQNTDEAREQVMTNLYEGVKTIAGPSLVQNEFLDPEGIGTHITTSNKVGPTIADDIMTSSLYATIFALLLIFLYIAIRFDKVQYSMGAVAALFHDVFFVLGIFSILHGILPFSMEIDQAFIAAVLTVIGYSINDTVVVFDRIREYINAYTKKDKTEVINMAINSTVSRTVITSLTTLFVVFILLFFGGSSITGFAFALFIGIIVGTYSSIFIATPVMHDLTGDLKPKQKEKKSSFSRAKV